MLKLGHLRLNKIRPHGAEGDAKNREARDVDFNPKLEAHLKEMASRCQPDSQFLFPSPQRGN